MMIHFEQLRFLMQRERVVQYWMTHESSNATSRSSKISGLKAGNRLQNCLAKY
uniref:Uncharacterized protein n=1 Tax=Physcomitrium patens TaxID=3218 RepID=A0A2K1L1H4_PHYPA|nr:hypothetical protein PHYPA_002672 [Physcomitrium patens]